MSGRQSDSPSPAVPAPRCFDRVEEIEIGPVGDATGEQRRARLRRERLTTARRIGAALGLWLLLTLASLLARSAWPTDETRLLALAWEMWSAREFLLPTLNGAVIAQPPLVPWLMHAGWLAFGVSEWWARLVPALGALASLLLTWRLALLLWPGQAQVATLAPLVLLGTFAWSAMGTLAVTSLWLVASVLFAVWALVFMWRRRDHRAWLLLLLATASGLLAHGWVYTLFVYPLALLAPLWARGARAPVWRHWYADVGNSLLLGALPFAAWLAAVGVRAGWTSVYELTLRAPLLPTLDLLPAASEAWWYAAWLPLVFLPWSLWPIVWLRHWQLARAPLNAGLLLCLVWVASAVGLLSLLPVRQPHWLLPLLPAGAMVVAFLALDERLRAGDEHRLLAGMTLPLVLLGALTMIVPKLPRVAWAPLWLWEVSPLVGLGILVVGVALAWLPVRDTARRLTDIAVASTVFVVLAVLAGGALLDRSWRVEATAARLAELVAAGRPVAQVGAYHGEWHFAARLRAPLAVLEPARVPAWARAHPDGVVLAYGDTWRATARPLHEAPQGVRTVAIWEAAAIAPRGAEDPAGP